MKRTLLLPAIARVCFGLGLSAALAGCATSWVVDSDVRSYSRLDAAPAEATYRFERLPSQQADVAAQQRIEAMARPALEAAGLRYDEARPRYTAQISARVSAELSPWADPWLFSGPWGPGFGFDRGWYGPRRYAYWGGAWGPVFPPASNPWYAREVGVVLRELPSNAVVYETHARNDGPYPASGDVLPVMFRAALQGFPTPPAGIRRVDLPVAPARAQ